MRLKQALESPRLVLLFLTAYYGLRLGYFCAGPQSTLPYTSLSQNNGFSNVPCSAYTYRSKYLAANYAHDAIQGTDSASQTAKDSFTDSSNAYYHLIGASGIITALLAVAVVISAHQFFVNAAHAHGIAAPHHIASRLSLVILIIIEALVIIFWITIFPYTYFYNYEPTLLNVPSYDVYHTIGLGLAIQFAGLLVGLFGFVSFPKDIVVLKNAV